MQTKTDLPGVEEIGIDEGRDMLNKLVRDRLSISLDEFIGNFDNGVYDRVDDDEVLRLVMLIPFARTVETTGALFTHARSHTTGSVPRFH